MSYITVATHDKTFHCDEVTAVAILGFLHPEIKIIRTRDPEKINKATFVVDVGGIYNPSALRYDHHQDDWLVISQNSQVYDFSLNI